MHKSKLIQAAAIGLVTAFALTGAALGASSRPTAAPSSQPIACATGEVLVLYPTKTWACLVWPSSTASPTTSSSPSASPTTSPTSGPTTTTSPVTSSPSPTSSSPTPTSAPTQTVYLTGYGWRDNDCGGGGGDCAAYGDGHAGGSGTFADPVSLAVGQGGWPAGTKVYLPSLHRYAVVEDSCASCGAGYSQAGKKYTWIDVWVDGRAASASAAESCMNSLTGLVSVVLSPPANLPVTVGTISTSAGCTT